MGGIKLVRHDSFFFFFVFHGPGALQVVFSERCFDLSSLLALYVETMDTCLFFILYSDYLFTISYYLHGCLIEKRTWC